MSDTTITGLPLASGIDAATDWFALDRTSLGATQRINRNTMLGIAGDPVGTSDTQTISNKILGNTNLVTLLDGGFTLQNNVDPTKRAVFSAASITTGTTRTYTLPNASSTLADISTTQTLTNKTLTSPVITGGSIDNTTIMVDSIAGHTSANTGTIYGVSITSATLPGASLATGSVATTALADNSVTTAKIANSAVTPAKLLAGTGTSWATQTWTPTVTASGSMTISALSVDIAQYVQVANMVFFDLRISFTTGGTQSSTVNVTAPVASPLVVSFATNYNPFSTIVFNGTNTDTGYARFSGVDSTQIQVRHYDASATFWGTSTGRQIQLSGFYWVA